MNFDVIEQLCIVFGDEWVDIGGHVETCRSGFAICGLISDQAGKKICCLCAVRGAVCEKFGCTDGSQRAALFEKGGEHRSDGNERDIGVRRAGVERVNIVNKPSMIVFLVVIVIALDTAFAGWEGLAEGREIAPALVDKNLRIGLIGEHCGKDRLGGIDWAYVAVGIVGCGREVLDKIAWCYDHLAKRLIRKALRVIVPLTCNALEAPFVSGLKAVGELAQKAEAAVHVISSSGFQSELVEPIGQVGLGAPFGKVDKRVPEKILVGFYRHRRTLHARSAKPERYFLNAVRKARGCMQTSLNLDIV